MDKLWAPWRLKYITSVNKEQRGSVFSGIIRSKADAKNFVFIRSKHSIAVLNIFPYNNGHTLIVPKRKVNDLDKLSLEERNDLFDLLQESKSLLNDILRPAGFNIGMNIGRIAGAGIPDHLHIHVVPRWKGDANFMPVIADTRVISQSLQELYKKLVDAHTRRNRKNRK